jgi:pyridoxine/pyridoxamine 5'-phosphate oxidase
MCLSTVDSSQTPARVSSRFVLCKQVRAAEGALEFYTSATSKKGRAIETNDQFAC